MSFPNRPRAARDWRVARHLAKLDAAMRTTALSPAEAVRTRTDFLVEAVSARATWRLGDLGALVPGSRLSNGSLDVVFGSGAISDTVVLALVRLCHCSGALRFYLAEEGFGERLVAWMTFADKWDTPEARAHLLHRVQHAIACQTSA